MRLSAVVELLLILLLVAFAAYGRVIDFDEKTEERAIKGGTKQGNLGISTLSLKQATDNVNRYCTCNEDICNCCRDFHIPLVQLQGPGCASLQYMQGDNLAVQLSFGDNILTSTIVSGKNPKPVCVPLPGGFTKFCGRVYSIKRENKDHFKACLGLELQSSTELEASLRVSCFRFGPDGLKLRPAEPLPIVEAEASEDDDDDDDFFGLGSDDDDDEGTSPLANSVTNPSDDDEDEDEDEDILGFGALLDAITGEDEVTTKKPKVTTPAPLLQFTIPLLTKPTPAPLDPVVDDGVVAINAEEQIVQAEELTNTEEESDTENEFLASDATSISNEAEEIVTEASNKIISVVKPEKTPTKKFTVSDKKKPSITSTSINAIDNGVNKKKPLKKPVKIEDDEDDEDLLADDLDDDDDEEEELLSDDDDDEKDNEDDDDEDEKVDESENHKDEDEDEDEKGEIEDLDDDDDEEEDAVISAFVDDDGKKKGKVKKHQELYETDEDDSDYGLGLTGLLARSRHSRSSRSRQSKEMKL
ncbi:mitotic apparatus protein p62-like [Ceratina calcarata]|uniref:Mitotic apparatus protein p62-like n=1 Tax=Ceratina calcarata TaxID=156304 RepID=A0AAJ7JDI9_9HYME|nr:mitotic apparatus protein p62-like [Ceratina calcarata]